MNARIARSLAAVVLAFVFNAPARAATFTDLWWNPNESGWGVNMIEQQGVLFVTLFVYGQDSRPTWYVGPATTLSGSVYSGTLYATQGPYFPGFFNPAAVGIRAVGSVSFTPTNYVRGTLRYSVDGLQVTKSIERQTWRHINLGGTYYGAMDILNSSPCGLPPSATEPFFTTNSLFATVSSNGRTGSLTMNVSDGVDTLAFSGTYTQYGSIYEVSGTVNFAGTLYTAAIRDFTADDDGIRGNLLMLVAGCTVNFRFAAVRPG